MSWILMNKKNTALIIAVLIVLACLCLFRLYWLAIGLALLIGCVIAINHYVLCQIRLPLNLLSPKREITQIDTLIIGDLCCEEVVNHYASSKNRLVITAPDRSLYASSMILYHTGSVLKQGGTVVIVLPQKDTNKKITCFDTPFVSLVTSLEEKYPKYNIKNYYPFIVSPIRSLKQIYGSNRQRVETTCQDRSVIEYCRRKGFRLICLK